MVLLNRSTLWGQSEEIVVWEREETMSYSQQKKDSVVGVEFHPSLVKNNCPFLLKYSWLKIEELLLTTLPTNLKGMEIQTSFCKERKQFSWGDLLSLDMLYSEKVILLCQLRKETPRFLLVTLRVPWECVGTLGPGEGHSASITWERYSQLWKLLLPAKPAKMILSIHYWKARHCGI